MGFTFNYPNYTIGEDAYSHIEDVCLKYGKTAVVIGGKDDADYTNKIKKYYRLYLVWW